MIEKRTRRPRNEGKVAQERAKKAKQEGFLQLVLSKATFAEKVEAIREVNPYFYLLTPQPYPSRRNANETN